MGEGMFGVLPEGWEETTLGDVCRRGGGKIQTGPFGSQLHASDYVPVGIPTVMPANIGDNYIVEDGIARVRESDAQRLDRHRLRMGDIVYSRRGDVERRALVRSREVGWLCGTGSLLVRVGENFADSVYISLWLGHPQVRAWITQHAVGATMANLNTEILSEVPVVVPPLSEQRAIAGVLGALDEKVESNRRICGLVDGLVRSEFQRLATTESSKSVAVGDIINRVHQAVDPSRLSPSTGYIGLEHMPRGSMILDQWGTAEGLDSGKSFFEKSDVLFGKLRPNFRKVGVAPLAGICSTDILVLRPKPGFSVALALAVTTSEEVLGPAIAASSGTKMPRISWDYIAALPVRIPSTSGCDEFADLVDPMIQVAMSSVLENVTLQNTRDALLPELLSGRLRVKDAERIVEGAV